MGVLGSKSGSAGSGDSELLRGSTELDLLPTDVGARSREAEGGVDTARLCAGLGGGAPRASDPILDRHRAG